MTQLIMVRHGQTAWNLEERFRGRADIPLNATGLAQAEATGRRLAAQWQAAAVYASPLSRTVKTAAAIANPFGLPVQTNPSFIDLDYGRWQGMTATEARQHWPDLIEAWYRIPGIIQIPGGESLADLRLRATAALQELWSRHSGETFVVVSHREVNRVLLLDMLGLDNNALWRIGQDNCAVNVVKSQGGALIVDSLNDTCHLHG